MYKTRRMNVCKSYTEEKESQNHFEQVNLVKKDLV